MKVTRIEWDNNILLSSANDIGAHLSLTNLRKSFIKMRKNKGPKMKPWGTPYSTLAPVEVVILSLSSYSNVL